MKILFASGAQGPDYQCDMMAHGLKSLFGPEVVDVNRLWYLYQGAEVANLYGKGMTLYALLEEGQVDRSDISAKIKAKYFDFVVFGSIQREYSLLAAVRESYGASKIILIDGEDGPLFMSNIVKWGVYLKRELHSPQNNVWPIQFAIPAVKVRNDATKKRFMAPLDPMDTRTYVYNDETSYYEAYAESLFGKTMKKAGWECCRHLEIMANYTIPYFENLEFCPDTIMVESPKKDMLIAKAMVDYNPEFFMTSSGMDLWHSIMQRIHRTLIEKLTTERLATRVLDLVRSL